MSDFRRVARFFETEPHRFQLQHFSDYKNLKNDLNAFKPRIALLDLFIEAQGNEPVGINAIATIQKILPCTKIIILSSDVHSIQDAFKQGAVGYISKDDLGKFDEYLNYLEDLGQQCIASPSIVQELIRLCKSKGEFNLTDREKQIIALSALGCTVPLIVLKLNIAKYTIEEYIKNIKIRLNRNTMPGVVGMALYHQCIDLKRYALQFKMELD